MSVFGSKNMYQLPVRPWPYLDLDHLLDAVYNEKMLIPLW